MHSKASPARYAFNVSGCNRTFSPGLEARLSKYALIAALVVAGCGENVGSKVAESSYISSAPSKSPALTLSIQVCKMAFIIEIDIRSERFLQLGKTFFLLATKMGSPMRMRRQKVKKSCSDSNRIFFLRNQPQAHRIAIKFTLIGFDPGNDDHDEAKNSKADQQKNADNNQH